MDYPAYLQMAAWPKPDREQFGAELGVQRHGLSGHPLFTQGELIKLLDQLPRSQLQCYTMIPAADRMESIEAVDLGDARGEDIWNALEKGIFWLNLRLLQFCSAEFAQLLESINFEARTHLPSMRQAHDTSIDLLVTSPGAHTHYHIDRGPNMLWHISGTKRLWVYPTMDFSFVSQVEMEDIFAGEQLEYLPWDPELDDAAQVTTLTGGEVVSWPNSAPHRVENGDSVCVSLNYSFSTPDSLRRTHVQRANRYLLRPIGLENRSVREYGFRSRSKQLCYRTLNKLRPFSPSRNFRTDYRTRWRINSQEPCGVQQLGDYVLPEFLRRPPSV